MAGDQQAYKASGTSPDLLSPLVLDSEVRVGPSEPYRLMPGLMAGYISSAHDIYFELPEDSPYMISAVFI